MVTLFLLRMCKCEAHPSLVFLPSLWSASFIACSIASQSSKNPHTQTRKKQKESDKPFSPTANSSLPPCVMFHVAPGSSVKRTIFSAPTTMVPPAPFGGPAAVGPRDVPPPAQPMVELSPVNSEDCVPLSPRESLETLHTGSPRGSTTTVEGETESTNATTTTLLRCESVYMAVPAVLRDVVSAYTAGITKLVEAQSSFASRAQRVVERASANTRESQALRGGAVPGDRTFEDLTREGLSGTELVGALLQQWESRVNAQRKMRERDNDRLAHMQELVITEEDAAARRKEAVALLVASNARLQTLIATAQELHDDKIRTTAGMWRDALGALLPAEEEADAARDAARSDARRQTIRRTLTEMLDLERRLTALAEKKAQDAKRCVSTFGTQDTLDPDHAEARRQSTRLQTQIGVMEEQVGEVRRLRHELEESVGGTEALSAIVGSDWLAMHLAQHSAPPTAAAVAAPVPTVVHTSLTAAATAAVGSAISSALSTQPSSAANSGRAATTFAAGRASTLHTGKRMRDDEGGADVIANQSHGALDLPRKPFRGQAAGAPQQQISQRGGAVSTAAPARLSNAPLTTGAVLGVSAGAAEDTTASSSTGTGFLGFVKAIWTRAATFDDDIVVVREGSAESSDSGSPEHSRRRTEGSTSTTGSASP